MHKKCLKCSHEADVADDPLAACPKCGAIYTRVEEARLRTTSAAPAKARQSVEIPIPIIRKGAIFLAIFIAGYFAGREHIKYEMRQALVSAFPGLDYSPRTSAPALPPAPTKPAQFITATLISKRWRPSDYTATPSISDAVEFAVTFRNSSDRALRAFDGVLRFEDLLGNEVISAKVEINDPVPARGELKWDGELDFNQFKPEHTKLRNADLQSLRTVLFPRKVLYADGQIDNFAE